MGVNRGGQSWLKILTYSKDTTELFIPSKWGSVFQKTYEVISKENNLRFHLNLVIIKSVRDCLYILMILLKRFTKI